MTQEKFEQLVRKLEKSAAESPAWYRVRVGLLAAAGYGYIFLILALLGGLIYFLAVFLMQGRTIWLAVKIGIPAVVLAGVALRALWVRLEPPPGHVIQPHEAPRLFEDVEEICSRLKSPKVHRIQIDDEFNASMAQVPRLGVFGWFKGYLTIGLPYLQALSREQIRAVIGHELGHLSGNHGRFSTWIYRVRRAWASMLEAFEADERTGSKLFTAFFNRYAPYLNAYSFVLARAHEYQADRCAAEVAGSRVAADMLICIHVKDRLPGWRFWPKVWQGARQHNAPPRAVYANMSEVWRAGVSERDARLWSHEAFHETTGYLDTHPCLSERLSALGHQLPDPTSPEAIQQVMTVLAPPQESAAEYYFGDSLPALTEKLSAEWERNAGSHWQERFAEAETKRKRLQELEQKAATGELDENEEWERADYTENILGEEAAIPLLRAILEREPTHVSANFALGRILLQRDDEAGCAHLDAAMAKDITCIPDACEHLRRFLLRRGEWQMAQDAQKRGWHQQEILDNAEAERDAIPTAAGPFLPHGADPALIQQMVEAIRNQGDAEAVYLVKKDVKYLPEKPHYILGLVPKRSRFRRAAKQHALESRLLKWACSELVTPGPAKVLLMNYYKDVARALHAFPGAKIYG